MPRHDYVCPVCRFILADQVRSVEEGAQSRLPDCPHCAAAMEWIPQIGRMDAYEPFQAFQTTDGAGRPVTIDSLHRLRQVERESEQLAAEGRGQRMVWRHYAQDASNRDVNTLGTSPEQAPTEAAKRRFTGHAVAGDPDRAFGPGVSEANASAL